ncbi:YdcF family protein [Sinorhizobium sp. BG8]|uniref:YdcF family protein n=1 Tax=Sinorhizobium sp. BG8 TaxID=2613773 RepID=UPI001FF01FBF|nr:YdcF family protein [Sinorhizobium sp. BG8]
MAWLAAQPLSLSFVLLAGGMIFGALKWRRLRSLALLCAALLLFVTLFTSTGTVLLQPLEDRFERTSLPASGPGCIIVLGGGIEAEVIAARGGFEINQAGDRFIETLRLARLFPQARILISGGDGSFSGTYAGDAAVSRDFFETFGIPPERLLLETQSRTTFENVSKTSEVLTTNNLSGCLLVTSAFHMPRAMGLFRRAGIDVQPWPTDYRTTGVAGLAFDFTQPSTNAQIMTTALREWTGLLAYYVTGRTDALFPG